MKIILHLIGSNLTDYCYKLLEVLIKQQTDLHIHTYINTYIHAYAQYILPLHHRAQTMAIGCATIHLSQKQKHDQQTVNSQLHQFKITNIYILNGITIVK